MTEDEALAEAFKIINGGGNFYENSKKIAALAPYIEDYKMGGVYSALVSRQFKSYFEDDPRKKKPRSAINNTTATSA